MNDDTNLGRLHADLGFKRLSPTWAKLEICIGLLSVGLGIALLVAKAELWTVVSGLALFVLGGYLAMAGNRSHLYQSNNKLAAYLVDQFHNRKNAP